MAGSSAVARSVKMSIKTGAAAALIDISGVLNDFSISASRSMVDTTTYDPDNTKGRVKAWTPTLSDGTISMGGPWTEEAHWVFALSMKNALGGAGAVQHFEHGPFGRASNQPKATGDMFINRMEVSIEATGVPMISGEGQVDGKVTWANF